MKYSLFLFPIFFCLVQPVSAQKNDLFVKSSEKGLYLEHKVAPRESFFSVGRLYNVSPKYIAAYNKLDMARGLFIDQKLRIPLSDTNFTQQGNRGTPVYYKVKEKETLPKVSKANGDVSLENLRSWNNLEGDNIREGQKLVIGFLLSKEMTPVSLAKKQTDPPKREEKTVQTEPVTDVQPIVKPEEKKPEVKVEEKKPEPLKQVKEQEPVIPDQGYFKPHFEQQVKKYPVSKNETVTAGIFKTLSGWQDARYYLLMDAVQPGTIVKVTNPTNNKTIYAKVLGEMSGIRQNEGFNIRISNAAATALEITEQDKFIVKVTY